MLCSYLAEMLHSKISTAMLTSTYLKSDLRGGNYGCGFSFTLPCCIYNRFLHSMLCRPVIGCLILFRPNVHFMTIGIIAFRPNHCNQLCECWWRCEWTFAVVCGETLRFSLNIQIICVLIKGTVRAGIGAHITIDPYFLSVYGAMSEVQTVWQFSKCIQACHI